MDELAVLVRLEVAEAVAVEVRVDSAVDLDPVTEVADVLASVADRRDLGVVENVPAVDLVGDERDPACGAVGLSGEQQVLVVKAFGEPDAVAVEELPAVELVGAQGVEQQVLRLADAVVDGMLLVEPRVPLRAPVVLRDVDPDAQPGDEVGVGAFGREQQVLRRVPLQRVIAVEEHDVRRPRGVDAHVARAGAAAAVLGQRHQTHPVWMLRREPRGDLAGAVGGGVVDDDDLEVVQRLVEHRLDGGRQPVSVVVRDDDDGDVRISSAVGRDVARLRHANILPGPG